jgi:hypothetical protein
MSSNRPYFNARITELEAEFQRKYSNPAFLRALLQELKHRSQPRALRLKAEVEEALAELRPAAPPRAPSPASAPAAPRSPESAPPTAGGFGTPSRSSEPNVSPMPGARPFPAITDAPTAICDAWTALEVLSPHTYVRPEELAQGRDVRAVASLDRGELPWERGEPSRPNKKLFYQVALGSVDMDAAVQRILAVYADTRVEQPAARGRALLGVVILDNRGRPVENSAIGLSSFGWGVPRALRGELAQLAGWREAERSLVERMEAQLRRTDAEGEPLPVTRADLARVYAWLVNALGLPRTWCSRRPSRSAATSTTGAAIPRRRC